MSRKVLEVRSRTVKEAVDEGLDQLQLKREDVSVKVLEEPARIVGFSSDAIVWLVYDSPGEQSRTIGGEEIADEEIQTIDEPLTETDETAQDNVVENTEVPSVDSTDVEESEPSAESDDVTATGETAQDDTVDKKEVSSAGSSGVEGLNPSAESGEKDTAGATGETGEDDRKDEPQEQSLEDGSSDSSAESLTLDISE